MGSREQEDVPALPIRPPPPLQFSPKPLSARTQEGGGVLQAIKEGSLLARPQRPGDEVTE